MTAISVDYRRFTRNLHVATIAAAPAQRLWDEVESLGGKSGWRYGDWLWQLRGEMDRLFGGVGMRRQVERQGPLKAGDVLDFYRVHTVIPGRQLTLDVEMKLPGDGIMEIRLTPLEDGRTSIDIAAYFRPAGVFGLAYWSLLLPLHRSIFQGLARALVHRAEMPATARP